ncbi:M15 family metallopeptidase [Paenibacillus segetis]|uniref:M15 family metallopeptidase n=1 Tax=Paenibacillus segetis TaxID=1325360 RepID=UPI001E290466|nr:M15 family metallopeptidase [Paenibacillus segetis]
MRKIAYIFAMLYILTGCRSPIDEPSVPVTENNQDVGTSIEDSVEIVYKQVEGLKPLGQASSSQKGEVIATKKVNNTKVEIYRVRGDEHVLAASISVGSTNYDIGEIGYGNMADFPIEEVEVFGDNYIKIIGAIGANSPVADYILPDPERPMILHIEAHTVEADVDQDGVKEIVSTVGTAANTTIYKLHNKQMMASDLNELMKAQMVMYDPKTNIFQIQNSNTKLAEWKLQGSMLQFINTNTTAEATSTVPTVPTSTTAPADPIDTIDSADKYLPNKHTPEPPVTREPEKKGHLPESFVYLDEYIPSAQQVMGYSGENNFVGTPIDGYLAPLAIVTEEAALALQAVSDELEQQGLILVFYDAYRPQKAVDHFIRWSLDEEDLLMKESFYPHEEKSTLFKKGYLSKRSGHSRGSTVDVTLAYADTGEELDMGSPVDMLDVISNFNTEQITQEQAANRQLLKQLMTKHNFKSYSKEWWHYTLKAEPFPNKYFDFDVE